MKPEMREAGHRLAAQNAVKHGLLSRLRPADDVEGLALEIWADFCSGKPTDFPDLWQAVTVLAREELALARVKERQRAADSLFADLVSTGDFFCSAEERIVARHFGLPLASLHAAGLAEVGLDLLAIKLVSEDPLERLRTDRRLLRRYQQEVRRRRRQAVMRVFALCDSTQSLAGGNGAQAECTYHYQR